MRWGVTEKLLYIAGYGRSGSTVLAAILGTHPAMVSVGEVTFIADDWPDPDRPCSCGEKYIDCEFWRALTIDEDRLATVAAVQRDVDRHLRWSLVRGHGPMTNAAVDEYRRFNRAVLAYARATSGQPIIVDSSKSARGAGARALALRRYLGEDVFVIHLVRNGVATVDSMVNTGSNWVLEGHTSPRRFPAARASVGWIRANAYATIIGRVVGRDRYLQLRYEDLVADPVAAFGAIGRLIGEDLSDLAARIVAQETFPMGHVVGGNRIRMEGPAQLRRAKSLGVRTRLRPVDRVTVAVVAGWLHRFYGYRNF